MPLLLSSQRHSLCDFRYLGLQVIDGRKAEVIAFAGHPVPEAVSGNYNLSGKVIPLILQGVVWIDSTTYQIVRIGYQELDTLLEGVTYDVSDGGEIRLVSRVPKEGAKSG